MKLYPLKFDPIFEYRVWGGENLKNVLGKSYTKNQIGESWEISAVPGKETVVSDGALKGKRIKDLISLSKDDFLGDSYQSDNTEFPLLIKFIDSASPLSIQVHPDDVLAKKRHKSLGKNEMWYIMPSEDNASITVGFKEKLDQKSYKSHIKNGTITDVLNTIDVKEGDVFYIPAGRVHAIGTGVTLAEIQQSSNITYRIYDYDRIDKKTGTKRELHTDQALEAVDYSIEDSYNSQYSRTPNCKNKLVNSPFFKTNFLKLDQDLELNIESINSFIIYMCVKGKTSLKHEGQTYNLKMGECILIPAVLKELKWKTENAELIEIYV
ncbi:MAG: type I phosphomannose isomerase catalytic subunit [Nonlabens sp.]